MCQRPSAQKITGSLYAVTRVAREHRRAGRGIEPRGVHGLERSTRQWSVPGVALLT